VQLAEAVIEAEVEAPAAPPPPPPGGEDDIDIDIDVVGNTIADLRGVREVGAGCASCDEGEGEGEGDGEEEKERGGEESDSERLSTRRSWTARARLERRLSCCWMREMKEGETALVSMGSRMSEERKSSL